MSMQDPIADMLTRIRNAVRNHDTKVTVKNSKVCTGIADVLKSEGYINDFDVIDDGKQGLIRIELRYGARGEKVIHHLKRVSKTSCRVYTKKDDLPRPMGGLGIAIISTSKGILSDRQCRTENVGGELLCTIE